MTNSVEGAVSVNTGAYDWPVVSKDPTSVEAYRYCMGYLQKVRKGRIFDFLGFVKEFVEQKSVLDIGIVEHDPGHFESDGWKHKSIRQWAREVVGLDILEDEVKELAQRGYNVVCADATSDADLGKRFERVVVGDVIEHVDNPVALLKFAGRHLTDDGRILITTPNPLFYLFILRTMREGTFIANLEHVAWVTPSMALEIGRRAGLELEGYWQLQSSGGSLPKRFLHKVKDIWFKDSELFTAAFFYVYKRPQR